MATRNFWIECTIDGRTRVFKGGPRASNGGMTVRVYQRDEGDITQAVHIDCRATSESELISEVGLLGVAGTHQVRTHR